MAFLDTDPVQRGTAVVIPREHVEDIWDLDAELFVKVFAIAKSVAHRMKEVIDTEGITIFGQGAKPPGSQIHHFHVLVIPLGKGERRKFTKWWVSAARKARRSELDRLARSLRFDHRPARHEETVERASSHRL